MYAGLSRESIVYEVAKRGDWLSLTDSDFALRQRGAVCCFDLASRAGIALFGASPAKPRQRSQVKSTAPVRVSLLSECSRAYSSCKSRSHYIGGKYEHLGFSRKYETSGDKQAEWDSQ
jgi:hypothetical protein